MVKAPLSYKKRLRAEMDRKLAIARQNPESNLTVKVLPPGKKWHGKPPKLDKQLKIANSRIEQLEQIVERLAKSKDKADFYNSQAWQKSRYAALRRSNGRCELCGISKAEGAIIQVDHIKPRSKHPELELDPNNLQVLCRPCNLGKSNTDSIDWRRPELKIVGGA